MNDLTPEEALQEVIPTVQRYAKTHERYGVEADDIAQEALIGLYKACCRDVPSDSDQREKLAVACTQRSAIQLHRYATRQARDSRRTVGTDCLRRNQPLTEPHREIEVDELIDHAPDPVAAQMRLGGHGWKEISEKFGGSERQWRYRLRKQFSRVLQPA